MAPPSRKRRAVADDDDDDSSEPDRRQSTQRRRRDRDGSSDDDDDNEDAGGNSRNTQNAAAAESEDQLVKKLVRYVMACEYSRTIIKREGIREKVFAGQKVAFNKVFRAAQEQLTRVFGMQLAELPLREKTSLKDRRAAFKVTKQATSSGNYVLVSALPEIYRVPDVLPPSHIPSAAVEAEYTALYTLIITLIMLNGGTLPNGKLTRYLERMNANVNTPVDKTEAVLQRMCKQAYIIKNKESTTEGEIIEWTVGPRGKVEVGSTGADGLVREAYGDAAPDDLTSRIASSLGIKKEKAGDEESVVEGDG